jgi:hypothetical protein
LLYQRHIESHPHARIQHRIPLPDRYTRPTPVLAQPGDRAWRVLAFAVMLLVGAAGWHPAVAQTGDVPPIVTKGFDAYRENGAAAAVDAWFVGSPAAAQPTSKGNVVQSLANIESSYGRYAGYDVLRTVAIGPHIRRVYVILLYDRGPVYAYFDCYQASSGWEIPFMQMNTKAADVLPVDMLSRSPS